MLAKIAEAISRTLIFVQVEIQLRTFERDGVQCQQDAGVPFFDLFLIDSLRFQIEMYLSKHNQVNFYLLAETLIVFIISTCLANFVWRIETTWKWLIYLPILFFQGLWLDRIYIVGHETTHRKLFPENRFLNDFVGMLMLLPLAVPLQIYRKIHQFHHGFNRRDNHTAALDTFVSTKPLTLFRRFLYQTAWFIGVFGSGYFWHSFAAIVIFLFLPTSTALNISPAFKHWRGRDRLISWGQFLLGGSFHVVFYFVGGFQFWLVSLAFPILVFSWVWSLLVYIFHYHTSIGREVRYNVRSLERHWFFSWLLMNFNEHATHHAFPHIPWYELPKKRIKLPQNYEQNQNVTTVWPAIRQQFHGAKIVYEPKLTTSQTD